VARFDRDPIHTPTSSSRIARTDPVASPIASGQNLALGISQPRLGLSLTARQIDDVHDHGVVEPLAERLNTAWLDLLPELLCKKFRENRETLESHSRCTGVEDRQVRNEKSEVDQNEQNKKYLWLFNHNCSKVTPNWKPLLCRTQPISY
jgi:hypothetical protein